MTDFEKLIYNTHLKVSRVSKNKPYKFRNNFDNIDDNKRFLCKKLAHFFAKHNNINIDRFFLAPFKIYQDNPTLDLKFYTSLKACKLYFDYVNSLNRSEINSKENKEFFLNSGLFITKYCNKHKIKWDDYITHKENKTDTLNSFFSHLKSGDVSVYLLYSFPEFSREFKKADREVVTMMLKDVIDDISLYRVKYYNIKPELKDHFNKIINLCKEKVDTLVD